MKGIDGGYKLSELLSRRRGSADAFVNVATVKFRFGAHVLSKKLVFNVATVKFRFGAHVLSKKLVFNETYERLA